VALAAVTLMHYVFSFQRFTLGVARRYAEATNEVSRIQLLMTPTFMGVVGWLGTLMLLAGAVLLGIAFAWWAGVAYFVGWQVLAAVCPLFSLNDHFGRLAESELRRYAEGPHSAVAVRLIADVREAVHQPIL
jgi:hypothetical protein